jgi:hypothetical protein
MSHFFPGRLDTHYFKRTPTGYWDRRRGGPKGQPFLLRKARRFEEDTIHTDGNFYESDDAIPCTCKHPTTHEGDGDAHCTYCDGQGFLWDEIWFSGYLSYSSSFIGSTSSDLLYDTDPGVMNINEPFLYTWHYIVVRHEDWIVRSAMDMDGNLMQKPIQPQNVYKLLHYRPMRMDFARTEYWKYKLRRVYP